jgi:hypothetical protein
MAFGLAVYASQHGLPHDHARLASRCWLRSPGWALSTGSHRKVSVSQLIHILLSQVAWRKPFFRPLIADEDWAVRDEGMATKRLKRRKKEGGCSIPSAPLSVHCGTYTPYTSIGWGHVKSQDLTPDSSLASPRRGKRGSLQPSCPRKGRKNADKSTIHFLAV